MAETKTNTTYVIKDSGERKQFSSGMVRDVDTGKTRYWRTFVGPMLKRWAEHLGKGAVKYPDVDIGVPNWTLASGPAEYQRFKESAADHFIQWWLGLVDEDHAAGVFFNINGAEYVKGKIDGEIQQAASRRLSRFEREIKAADEQEIPQQETRHGFTCPCDHCYHARREDARLQTISTGHATSGSGPKS
jgi:hypothetical protein